MRQGRFSAPEANFKLAHLQFRHERKGCHCTARMRAMVCRKANGWHTTTCPLSFVFQFRSGQIRGRWAGTTEVAHPVVVPLQFSLSFGAAPFLSVPYAFKGFPQHTTTRVFPVPVGCVLCPCPPLGCKSVHILAKGPLEGEMQITMGGFSTCALALFVPHPPSRYFPLLLRMRDKPRPFCIPEANFQGTFLLCGEGPF